MAADGSSWISGCRADGVELLHAVATCKFTGPIVLMSGCDAEVLRTVGELRCELGLNMRGALAKPIRLEMFRRVLAEHSLANDGQG